MANPLRTRLSAQRHMNHLQKAWKVAKEAAHDSKLPSFEIPPCPELMAACERAVTNQEILDAWDAVNHYSDAFLAAIQKIEEDAYQAMVEFEALARAHGYYVSSTLDLHRSFSYQLARDNID
jgi:hypothetical protein